MSRPVASSGANSSMYREIGAGVGSMFNLQAHSCNKNLYTTYFCATSKASGVATCTSLRQIWWTSQWERRPTAHWTWCEPRPAGWWRNDTASTSHTASGVGSRSNEFRCSAQCGRRRTVASMMHVASLSMSLLDAMDCSSRRKWKRRTCLICFSFQLCESSFVRVVANVVFCGGSFRYFSCSPVCFGCLKSLFACTVGHFDRVLQ